MYINLFGDEEPLKVCMSNRLIFSISPFKVISFNFCLLDLLIVKEEY